MKIALGMVSGLLIASGIKHVHDYRILSSLTDICVRNEKLATDYFEHSSELEEENFNLKDRLKKYEEA